MTRGIEGKDEEELAEECEGLEKERDGSGLFGDGGVKLTRCTLFLPLMFLFLSLQRRECVMVWDVVS